MKTIALLLASFALFTSIASAHPGCETPRRVVGYTRCGDAIIATYDFVGLTRCGEPIHRWVTHYPRESERYYTREPERVYVRAPERSYVRERESCSVSVRLPRPPLPFSLSHSHDYGRDCDRDEHRSYRCR